MKPCLLLLASTLLALPAVAKPLDVVRYTPNGKLVHLPVRVNNSRPLGFTFDCGAPHSVIDAATARALHIELLAKDEAKGAGRGTFARQHAAPIELALGRARLAVPDPWVIDLSGTGTEHRMDGLLGQDFLERYVVTIDPVKRTFAIFDPKTFRGAGKAVALPLEAVRGKLYLDMSLTLSNGIHAVHRFRIDTGSEDAASDSLVRQSPERRKAVQGVGLGERYEDYSGVFETIGIGPWTIHHAWGPSNEQSAVGMEILRRFTMTFDVPHGRLWLEPNRHLHDPVPAPGN
jgi:hypothetical protein